MVAQEVNINNFYWGLHSKIKVEIGLKNNIKEDYPDIIWFPQGIFLITTFNTSHTTNNYQITLNGKDKMCLLNGEVGGSLPASINFSEIDTYNLDTMETITELIPIKEIIKEAIHVYAKEPYHNIIINDVEDYGVELLEYRGEEPLYLLRPIEEDAFTNITVYGDTDVYEGNSNTVIKLKDAKCLPLINIISTEDLSVISLAKKDKYDNFYPSTQKYYIAKVEYGQTAGYRKTPLTWPNDSQLVSAVGESITSILDKINQKFYSGYEYFYDLEGHFVFQKKKNYINTTWNPIKDNEDGVYIDNSFRNEQAIYNFNSSNLITSFNNTPNLQNLKNDYIVWGKRNSVTGSEIPVHLRYAIDNKPKYYKSYDQTIYTDKEYDWRELIYQMAKDYYNHNQEDDFLQVIAENNFEYYPTGYTGYEQYYIDLSGFWRQLYCYGIEKSFENGDTPNLDYEYYEIKDGKYQKKSYLIKWLSLDTLPSLYEKSYNKEGYEIFNSKGESIYKLSQSPIQREDLQRCEFRNNKNYGFITFDNEKIYYIKNPNYTQNNGEEKFLLFTPPEENEQNIFEYNFYPREKYYQNAEKIGYYVDVQGAPISIDLKNFNPELRWNYDVIENPEKLNFWFDFLDQSGELDRFQVNAIGERPKVVNDNSVTAIYFRETPNIIFIQNEEDKYDTLGYTWVQLPKNMNIDNMFSISAQKKSAKEVLDNLLYNHSYCIENITINAIPVYRLEPNRLINIIDEKSKINGEYIISKITIPLTYNGTMSITATKAVERLY